MGKGGKDKKSSSSNANARRGLLKMLSKGIKADKKKSVPQEEPEFLKDIDRGVHQKDAEPELRLWLSDGRVIKNIEELFFALKGMKDKVYKEHVNKGKNEFAEWVGEILRQDKLANEMLKASSKKDMEDILRLFVQRSKALPLIPAAEKLLEEKELPAPKNLEEALMPLDETESSTPTQNDELKAEEMALVAEEAALNREEESLNSKRLEISKRRYALIKKRGEFERRKFQHFLSNYNSKVPVQEIKTEEEPLPAHGSAAKEQLATMIGQARDMAKAGRINEAMGVFNHIKSSMSKSLLTDIERKKIEYDLLGLETEIRLAAL
jgi:hypothetical protein